MRSQLRSVHESDEVPVSQSGCENSRIIPHVALLELCPEVCLAFYFFSRGRVLYTSGMRSLKDISFHQAWSGRRVPTSDATALHYGLRRTRCLKVRPSLKPTNHNILNTHPITCFLNLTKYFSSLNGTKLPEKTAKRGK